MDFITDLLLTRRNNDAIFVVDRLTKMIRVIAIERIEQLNLLQQNSTKKSIDTMDSRQRLSPIEIQFSCQSSGLLYLNVLV